MGYVLLKNPGRQPDIIQIPHWRLQIRDTKKETKSTPSGKTEDLNVWTTQNSCPLITFINSTFNQKHTVDKRILLFKNSCQIKGKKMQDVPGCNTLIFHHSPAKNGLREPNGIRTGLCKHKLIKLELSGLERKAFHQDLSDEKRKFETGNLRAVH